jgi:hypothetical protein
MDKRVIKEWLLELIKEELEARLYEDEVKVKVKVKVNTEEEELEFPEDEIKEISTSANAGPYNTPFAFAGDKSGFRKRIGQNSGYKLVGTDDVGHGKIDSSPKLQRKLKLPELPK